MRMAVRHDLQHFKILDTSPKKELAGLINQHNPTRTRNSLPLQPTIFPLNNQSQKKSQYLHLAGCLASNTAAVPNQFPSPPPLTITTKSPSHLTQSQNPRIRIHISKLLLERHKRARSDYAPSTPDKNTTSRHDKVRRLVHTHTAFSIQVQVHVRECTERVRVCICRPGPQQTAERKREAIMRKRRGSEGRLF